MPTRFRFRAVTPGGEPRQGLVTAETAAQVEEYLANHELIPVRILPHRERRPLTLFGLLGGTDYETLIMFTKQMATLYRAGIPMLRALSIIRIGPPESRFNAILDQIRSQVQGGKSLSEAMTQHRDLFSKVYTASIAAGEESGNLEYTLNELSSMLEREMELSRQLKSALRYPAMVILAIAAAFIVLMTFVIPKFMSFYAAFGAQLPLPTRIIINVSNAVTSYWWVGLGLLGIGLWAFRRYIATEGGRLWYDQNLLRIPVLGDMIIKTNVARFTLMFRMMFKAGIPMLRSVEILAETIKNAALAREIQILDELVRKGQGLSEGHYKYFPPMAIQLMQVGLESGSLETMLGEIGNHYAQEVSYKSKHLTAIIEPLLTFVIGAFVLILALAIFLPMWNLIHVIRG